MSEALPQPAAPNGNRFAVVTLYDNSAPLIIVTTLALIFAFLVFAVRILVIKRKRHSFDDGAASWGHLLALGQGVAMFLAIRYGAGKSLDMVDEKVQLKMAKALFAARTLFLASLYFSKLSILLVIRSLFYWEHRRKTLFIDAAILFATAWGVAAVLAVSINCSPSYIFGKVEKCPSYIPRLRTIMILDMVTEVIIFTLPPAFLQTFRITAAKKFLVISAFAFRLPLIALSILYLLTTTSYLSTHSTGTAIVPSLVYQQIFLGYALMSATIPCLKSFVEGFTTGGLGNIKDSSSGSMAYTPEQSFEMGWVRRKFGNARWERKPVVDKRRSILGGQRRLNSQTSQQPIVDSGSGSFV